MAQLTDQLRLPLKESHRAFIAERQMRKQDLEGHSAVYAKLVGLVDSPHPSDSDQRVNPIFVIDGPANEIVRVLHRQQLAIIQADPLRAVKFC